MRKTKDEAEFEKTYITMKEIMKIIGVSRVAVFKAAKKGRLPNVMKVTGLRCYIWKRDFITPYLEEWKKTLIEKRKAKRTRK